MRKFVPLLFIFTLIGALPYAPEFYWTPPNEFMSGLPLNPETDLIEYRFYCNGALVHTAEPSSLGWTPAPSEMTTNEELQCYMTAVSLALNESDPSNILIFTVLDDAPRAMYWEAAGS